MYIWCLRVLMACGVLAASFVAAQAQFNKLKNLDPTNKNSKLREGVKELDPTNKNSAIRDPKKSLQEAAQSTWGEVGRVAYPAAANTMSTRHSGSRMGRIQLRDQRALGVHFGGLPGDVVLVWGAKPMDKWGTSGTTTIRLSGVDTVAQTYGTTIYIDKNPSQMTDYERLRLLAHELVHVQQNQRYKSLNNFGYHYFRKYAEADFRYDKNELEREANAVENGPAMQKIWEAFQREGQSSGTNSTTAKGNNNATKNGNSTVRPQATASTQIQYTLQNDSGRTVKFRLPSGETYSLEPGKRGSYKNTGAPDKLTIQVINSGKTYRLRDGNHRFWFMKKENQIGFDLNYKG